MRRMGEAKVVVVRRVERNIGVRARKLGVAIQRCWVDRTTS
jgi:hypothetical protein